MKNISISILGKTYKVSVDDEFSEFLSLHIKRDLGGTNISDTKQLLNAYVKRCYELYLQEKEISDIHSNIEENT